MTYEQLSAFLGWATVINFIVLFVAFISLTLMGDFIRGIHGRMFRLEPRDLNVAYFAYLSNYKVLTVVFCLVPWVALQIIH